MNILLCYTKIWSRCISFCVLIPRLIFVDSDYLTERQIVTTCDATKQNG